MTLPVPTQRTWNTYDVTTSAMMNSNVRDAVNFLTSPPLFIGQQTVAQSLTNGAFVPITLDNEVVDTYNGHSTSTNTSRYVVQVAGYYLVIGRAGTPGNADTKRMTCVSVNGTLMRNNEQDSPDADLQTIDCVAIVHCNVNDYIEVQAYQLSGGSISTTVSNTAYGPSLEVIWVHA